MAEEGEAGQFGFLLRRYRLAAGMSQEELAERAGLSQRGISDLERGARREPHPATVRRLADSLGLTERDRQRFLDTMRPQGSVASNGNSVAHSKVPEVAGTGMAAKRDNLPRQQRRLIGREREVAAVQQLLLEAEVRLVTLTGTGGAGKTSLALEIARNVVDAFPDGVWLVELGALTERQLIPQTFAQVLGVRDELVGPTWEKMLSILEPRRLLVVLDNCEHLIDDCAAFADRLLATCPDVRVLATSREPLRIRDERTWRVPSLAVPTPTGQLCLDEISKFPSVQLFAERARAVLPDFTLTDRNAQVVGSICRALDGLPLGIELAAAWVFMLGLEEIREKLDRSLHFLVGGSRTAPDRQQTLRSTLDWSHALLTSEEQVLFHRLGAFAGGWTLGAAEWVCAADVVESQEVMLLLARLVNTSLVIVEESDGRARYRMLEPVRQYATEQLEKTEDVAALRSRHLRWYLQLADRSEPESPGSNRDARLARLRHEEDNLRVALTWGYDNDAPQALALAARLVKLWFWRGRGHSAEGRYWLEAAIATKEWTQASPGDRGLVLLGAGRLAADAGAAGPEQVSRAEDGVQLLRDADDHRGLQEMLLHLGRCVLESGGPFERIYLAFDESLRIAQMLKDERGIGAALANLAYLAWCEGRQRDALELYSSAVKHVRLSGDLMFTGMFLSTLGWYTFVHGDILRARQYKEESVAILRSLDAPEAVGLALLGLAHLVQQEGDAARLRAVLIESSDLLREADSPGLIDWVRFVGHIELMRGEHAQGLRLLAAGDSDGPRFGSYRALFYLMPRNAFQESIAAARAQLGANRFDSLWQQGTLMTIDQAVTAALDAIDAEWPGAAPVAESRAGSPLTPRQQEVAVLIAQGLTNREIALRLVITPRAAAAHVEHILDKLGVSSRTQVGVWVTERGLLTLSR